MGLICHIEWIACGIGWGEGLCTRSQTAEGARPKLAWTHLARAEGRAQIATTNAYPHHSYQTGAPELDPGKGRACREVKVNWSVLQSIGPPSPSSSARAKHGDDQWYVQNILRAAKGYEPSPLDFPFVHASMCPYQQRLPQLKLALTRCAMLSCSSLKKAFTSFTSTLWQSSPFSIWGGKWKEGITNFALQQQCSQH